MKPSVTAQNSRTGPDGPGRDLTGSLGLAALFGLGALALSVRAVVAGTMGYVAVGVGVLATLALWAVLTRLGRASLARQAIAVMLFGLVIASLAHLGSASLALLLLPLFVAGAGVFLSSRSAFIYSILSVLSYVGVAFVQTRSPLRFANTISIETFVARVVVASLALLGTGLLFSTGLLRAVGKDAGASGGSDLSLAGVEVVLGVAATRNLALALEELPRLVCRELGFDVALVYLLDAGGRQAVLRASSGEAAKSRPEGHWVTVGGESVVGLVTAGTGPLVAGHGKSDTVHWHNELLKGMRSQVVVPLEAGERMLGALEMQSGGPSRAFAEQAVETLVDVGSKVAVLLESLEGLAGEDEGLTPGMPPPAALSELAVADDIQTTLKVLREHMAGRFDRLSVVRLEDGLAGEVQPVTVGVWDREDLAPYGVSFSDLGLVLDSPRPLIVADAEALDDEMDALLRDTLERLRARAFAALPLRSSSGARARPEGFLLLYRRDAHDFPTDEVCAMETWCEPLAASIARQRGVESLARQRDRLAIVDEFAHSVATLRDLDAVGAEVSRAARRLLAYEHLSVALPEGDQGSAALRVLSDEGGEGAGSRVFPLDGTAIQTAISTGEPVLTPDMAESPFRDHRAWHAEGVTGAMVIPMRVGSEVVGTLNVGFDGGARPDADVVAVLERLAGHLAGATVNARQIAVLQASEIRASTLYGTAMAINTSDGTLQVIEALVSGVGILSDADHVRVLLAWPDPFEAVEYVEEVAVWQRGEESVRAVQSGHLLAPDSVPVLAAFPMPRETVVLNDPGEATQYATSARRALALVPLLAEDTWFGAFIMEKEAGQPFAGENMVSCRTLADLAAMTLGSRWHLRESRRAATREHLLHGISARLRQAPDVEALLQVAVEELGRALDVEVASAEFHQLPDGRGN